MDINMDAMQDPEPTVIDNDPTQDYVSSIFKMDSIDKAHGKPRFKPAVKEVIRKGDMFKTRRSVSLSLRDKHIFSASVDFESDFEIVGHQSNIVTKDVKDLKEAKTHTKTHIALPPISTTSCVELTRAVSDSKLVLGREITGRLDEPLRPDTKPFLQTQGYVPGVDTQVTIRQPYVLPDGINPGETHVFQITPIEADSESRNENKNDKNNQTHPETNVKETLETGPEPRDETTNDNNSQSRNNTNVKETKSCNKVNEDMPDPDYAISTWPPVGKDDISKHAKLNSEVVKNSKSRPQAYQEYIRKMSVQKKLLENPKPTDTKHVKRKNKKLQLKHRLRDTREDLLGEKPETPPKPRDEVMKPMKVIQSFRYSKAIAEYYRGQMKFRHSMDSLDGGSVNNDEHDEIVNGYLVKSLGPQVLNLCARTLPSCNPIELRLRRQQARQRAFEHGRLSKRSSTLSQSSQRLSRSHDSFMFQGQGQFHESVPGHSSKSLSEEIAVMSTPVISQPIKGRFLPDIPEVRVEKLHSEQLKTDNGEASPPQRTKIVLSLPLLTSEV